MTMTLASKQLILKTQPFVVHEKRFQCRQNLIKQPDLVSDEKRSEYCTTDLGTATEFFCLEISRCVAC